MKKIISSEITKSLGYFVKEICGKFKGKNNHKQVGILWSVLFLSLIVPATVNAHRGARNEVDTCRFSVGTEVIHFTAYTPTFSGGTGFCHAIPNIGLTHLVFDYEGKKLRNTTVEFEITKEPEGTRIFYQKPEKIKKGSIDAKLDFNTFGAGDYLAHVTIFHQGEKLDSHLPFSIGVESVGSGIPTIVIIMLSLVVIVFLGMIVMSRNDGKQAG
ncbi:MAG: hypothetical protein KAT04_06140 [Methylococcales bacterium]|nr:hypothetical protein [Methylococcales bacterium]